jgi:hypothetical protein
MAIKTPHAEAAHNVTSSNFGRKAYPQFIPSLFKWGFLFIAKRFKERRGQEMSDGL